MQPETYAPSPLQRQYYFPESSSLMPAPTDLNKVFSGLSYGQQQDFCTSFSLEAEADHSNGVLMGSVPGGLFMGESYCVSSSVSSLCGGGGAATTTTSGSGVTPDEKAMMALRNHKEAEKRRRERINSHLDRLRSLLPCSTKTDKATLLAQVVHRVRELKAEATDIITRHHQNNHHFTIPSQTDEYSVNQETTATFCNSDEKLLLRASLCCEDRSDLLSDLMEMVNSLNLKTVRAEMLSLGGRISNVLVLSGDRCRAEEYVGLLQDALKGIVQRSGNGGGDRAKRRRRLDVSNME